MSSKKTVFDLLREQTENTRILTTAKLIRRQVNITNRLESIDRIQNSNAKKALIQVNKTLSTKYGDEYRSICKFVYQNKMNLTEVNEDMITAHLFELKKKNPQS